MNQFNSIIHEGIDELCRSDTSFKIGLVDDPDYVQNLIDRQNNERS